MRETYVDEGNHMVLSSNSLSRIFLGNDWKGKFAYPFLQDKPTLDPLKYGRFFFSCNRKGDLVVLTLFNVKSKEVQVMQA